MQQSLLPRFVRLRMLNGGCRDVHKPVVILILVILTLVNLECDLVPLGLVLIDRFELEGQD